MDTDWCLTCGRRTNEDVEGYCSKTCMNLDRASSVTQSLPVHIMPHRPKFDFPKVAPARRTPYKGPQTRRVEFRVCASGRLTTTASCSQARFRDDELQDSRASAFVTTRWSGKDRDGILVWARAVFPGLEEERQSSNVDSASMSDLSSTRPPPFPLTAQNLAPPCVTVAPRHQLTECLASNPRISQPLPEDRTVPSSSQDDASLVTPATESVITSPAPDPTRLPPSKTRFSSLIGKMCSWMVPSRVPRAMAVGHATLQPTADCLAAHSHKAPRCYAPPYGSKTADLSEAPVLCVGHDMSALTCGDHFELPRSLSGRL